DREQRPLAALVIAEQRQRRQEHGGREQERLHARIEWLQPQPEMESDRAVNPHDQEGDRLQRAGKRGGDPEIGEDLRIALIEPEFAERDSGPDYMIGQEERNGEPECELGRLEPRPAEPAPLIERPEPKAHMGEKRDIEGNRAWARVPDRLLEDKAALHCVKRNVAERVIEE